jgi:GNAT superfamily N-acetyltransferase
LTVTIRRLQTGDNRHDFSSGNIDIDRFLRRFAGQNQFRHHIGTTYVAVEETTVLGYVTVSPAQVEIAQLPAGRRKGLPRYPLPVLRLARLGVDECAQGRGIGQLLLRCAFSLALGMRDQLGYVGVVVDAKPEAVSFYRRYGFTPLEVLQGNLGERPQPTPMFLEIGAIPE